MFDTQRVERLRHGSHYGLLALAAVGDPAWRLIPRLRLIEVREMDAVRKVRAALGIALLPEITPAAAPEPAPASKKGAKESAKDSKDAGSGSATTV